MTTPPRLWLAIVLLAPACSESAQEQEDTDTDAGTDDSTDGAGSGESGESGESTGLDTDPSESTGGPTRETTTSTSTSSSTSGAETTEPDTDTDESTGADVGCGNGVIDGDELCDEGEANENGRGCNVDCVVSGTLVATYEVSLGTACSGWAIEPAVRDDGNVLLASLNCDLTWTLRELSPDLVELASTTATFTTVPEHAIVRGSDWILGGWRCDMAVSEDGSITEVCAQDRVSGYNALERVDDERYITLMGDTVAQWGAASPSEGDAPEWTATVPPEGEIDWYSFRTATPGAAGSVVAAGLYAWEDDTDSYDAGYVAVFDAAGDPIESRTYDELQSIERIVHSPSGGLVATGSSDAGSDLLRIDDNLDPSWTIDACPDGPRHLDVDSAGQIVVDCGSGSHLRKFDDDGDELWSIELPSLESPPTYGGLVIDASDHVVRSTAVYDPNVPEWRLRIEKYAP